MEDVSASWSTDKHTYTHTHMLSCSSEIVFGKSPEVEKEQEEEEEVVVVCQWLAGNMIQCYRSEKRVGVGTFCL